MTWATPGGPGGGEGGTGRIFPQQEVPPQDLKTPERTPPSEEDSAEAERLKTEGEGGPREESAPTGGGWALPARPQGSGLGCL